MKESPGESKGLTLRPGKGRHRQCVLVGVGALLLSFIALLPCAAESSSRPAGDLLNRLEREMAAARTQVEMNAASRALAGYWDRRLKEEEKRVLDTLDEEARRLFVKAQAAWRAWRDAEVLLRGDAVRGGTLRPTAEKLNEAAMTEKRFHSIRQVFSGDDSVPFTRKEER